VGDPGPVEQEPISAVARRGFLVGVGAAAAAASLGGARPAGAASRQSEGAGQASRSVGMFATPLQNQFANWAFEYVAEGADVGELEAIANDMADDSDGAYYDAWYGHATRHRTQADESRRRGLDHTARYHYLRATVYASVSYKLLFGTPVDPRLKTAFATQDSAFRRVMALTNPPAEPDLERLGRRVGEGHSPPEGAVLGGERGLQARIDRRAE